MATIILVKKIPVAGGKVVPVYCAEGQEGVCYEALPCTDNDVSIGAAIQAHCDKRKANGLDYAGSQSASAKKYTVV